MGGGEVDDQVGQYEFLVHPDTVALVWLLAVAACRPAPWASVGTGTGTGTGTDSGVTARWHRRPAVLLPAAALLSQLVYPTTYDGLVAGQLLLSLLLVARNAVLIILCTISVASVR